MIDLNGIQQALKEWQDKNFPRSRYEAMPKEQLIDIILNLQFALGMNEEAGETGHQVLKASQGIREGVNKYNVQEIEDGAIDNFIYSLQLLSLHGVQIEQAIKKVTDQILKRDWIKYPVNGVDK
jgi:NTP pyrophosphatase (non-canonical NTP hydrolase)